MPILIVAGLVLLFAFLIVVGPMLTIIALNTLFGLGLKITLGTWAATFWLSLIVAGTKYNSKKNG